MRGISQTASARPRPITPARRWSTWLMRDREQRRRTRLETLETIERLAAEQRRALRSGESSPRLHPRL
jgi:hypothetical protein